MSDAKNVSQPHNTRSDIIQIFSQIEDPRKKNINFRDPLTTILFITIVCSLCGSNDRETIVVQANTMKEWLSGFVDMSNGIPCVRAFIRVFNILKPDHLLTVARSLGSKPERESIL